MKYKLLALSVAAMASAGAYGQSGVTVYGELDVGVEYVNNTANGHDAVRMTQGNLAGSLWGLRGVEDLGGGLKAVFTLEGGFDLDTGAWDHSPQESQARLFGRQAFVGVSGALGTLTAGRHQTPLYDFSVDYDPMGLATRYSLYSQDLGTASRADNSIKYTGKFGGLTASALYSFGYNSLATASGTPIAPGNGEIPGDARQGNLYAFGLRYATGPLDIGAVYESAQAGTGRSLGADIRTQRAAIAVTSAFGPAKAYAGYRWGKRDAANVSARSNLTWFGVGYQATPALLLTAAAYYQDVHRAERDPWLFVAGADYAFSKRTDLYLNLGYALNRNDSTLSLGDLGVMAGKDQFGAVMGVRHKF